MVVVGSKVLILILKIITYRTMERCMVSYSIEQ